MAKKKGRAYRRWKTITKYVSRIKKRMYWMRVQYGEYEDDFNGIKRKRVLWRRPESWKEADGVDSTGAKSLKDTPTPYSEPWKKRESHRRIKEIREESKRIIDNELNTEENDNL